MSKASEKAGPTAAPSASEVADVADSLGETALESTRPHLRPPRTLETTLFDRLERLYGPAVKRVLTTQYRMNEKIASFPSSALYENRLISDPSVSSRRLIDLPNIVDSNSEEAKDVLEEIVVFFDTAGCEFFERSESDTGSKSLGEGSKSNENEASVVANWARRLVNTTLTHRPSTHKQVALGVPANEIGIITPYQAQVSLLSSLLREEYPDMTIGTVDGLQGQEREVIILSLVRSNPTGEVGFLGEYRRLNVAMTRAKRQLVSHCSPPGWNFAVRQATDGSALWVTRTLSARAVNTCDRGWIG